MSDPVPISIRPPRWLLKPAVEGAAELAADMGLPPLMAQLLVQRGLTTVEEARDFLVPKLATLGDPTVLPEMGLAVNRILRAVDAKESIVLYGDYDVDGVTSMALMHLILKAYGLDTHLFLPTRMEEGYGLSMDGIAKCYEQFGKPALFIALDCGTTSLKEVAKLRADGVDCVIIDHHELSPLGRPDCLALVNPKLGTAHHYFCTAGLVFKVSHALLKARMIPGYDLKETLDLVALGTVADLVPLIDENRLLVRRGLEALAQTTRHGLKALKQIAGVDGIVQTHHVGFRLGPRLNAAGRLDTAATALQLLLAADPDEGAMLAELLEAHNKDRQNVEQQVHAEAEAMLAGIGDLESVSAIVLGSRSWHPGVIGIVASRISRLCHRPTILVSIDENGIGKGSGRSIPGFSLVEAIDICRAHLLGGGGHAMAAGISVHEDKIDSFRTAFQEAAREALSKEAMTAVLELDAEVKLRDLSLSFFESYKLLEPFGQKNPEPLFLCRNVKPKLPGRIMKDKHLRIILTQEGASMEARWFNAPIGRLPPAPWDVAMRIQRGWFRGVEQWQLTLEAVRTAESVQRG
ncbi:single-stranded-DNA-specific exonuclease RecJ [Prosthecobacter vanneervenii]|uniref:Single-stranded-DNA-specific exonuclease RecJ n=1 Tax=Prosthecobacter vanneervenii TaxID=48466 RepID=A0A7W7YFZ6_9BACT|nr:single-stranded-DNA-specific exonuclease RecJ [Prosthecobacter vanneervenii]MBB5035500.1 single-stranded-DNA-specific exonuclease [Prosthecobacter vanneervenii]